MKTFVCIVVILFSHFQSHSQWQKVGSPSGGNAHCVVQNATHVVAGCNDGIYYSTDNANTWTRSQVPQTITGSLVFFGNKLIAVDGCKLYQSYDDGETFSLLYPGWNCNEVIFVKEIDNLLWCGVSNLGIYFSS